MDCDGDRVYVGDIVVIYNRKKYDGWNGQVKYVGPGGTLTVSVGMPPGYNSMNNGEYKKLRRSRALGESP